MQKGSAVDYVYPYRFVPGVTMHLKGKIALQIPINRGEGRLVRPWLREVLGERARVSFNNRTKCWEVGRDHLTTMRDALVMKYGACDVTTESKLSTRIQCDDRCQMAEGQDCTCSCGGKFHGDKNAWHNWQRVGATTMVAHTSLTRMYRRRYIRNDLVGKLQ